MARGLQPKQDLLGITLTQLFILSAAWTFFVVVSIKNPLPLPSAAAKWVYNNPTETMVVATVIATIISSLTLSCFSRAAKHALREHIGARGSISLGDLSVGIAFTSASFTFRRKRRHIGPTLGTLIIASAFGLVNSAWATVLTPILVNVFVDMSGEELDLGNQAFDTVLGMDMNSTFGFSNGTLVTQPDSSNSLTSFAFTGGLTSATAFASGQPGILNFNNVTYSVSTGTYFRGILSAVYGDTDTTLAFGSSSPASFGGGPVPMNLKASSNLVGLSSSYNISQQGLSANVSCFNYTNPSEWYPIEIEEISVNATFQMDGFVNGIVPIANTTLPRMNCNPNTTGMIASMAAVNFDNSNYLASVVCPYTWSDAQTSDKIAVYHSGFGKYAAVPPTICEIVPVVTRTSVLYANQLVTSTPQDSIPIPYQNNINFWITLTVELEEWGFQTARVNSLGNMLSSLLTVGSTTFSMSPVESYQSFLEAYWKGVVEVTGTALRSGYTAYSQNITSDMRIPMVGEQNITTMGWKFDKIRIYSLIPITSTALMTFAAVAYALWHAHLSEHGEKRTEEDMTPNTSTSGCVPVSPHMSDNPGYLVVPRTAVATFNATDPIHLIVAAAAARQIIPGPDAHGAHEGGYWERYGDITVHFQVDRQRPLE